MKQHNDFFEKELSHKLTHMLDQTEPNEFRREAIWKKATAPAAKRYPALRVAAVASLALAILMAGSVGVNAATDGALFESVKKFCGLAETQQQVAQETLTIPNEIYAPVLVSCSDEYLVFANERGLMVYDQALKTLTAALDLQALDCNYFNADTIITHCYTEGNTLFLFNQAIEGKLGAGLSEDAISCAYLYDLTLAGQEEALSMTEDPAELADIRDGWQRYAAANVRDSFDEMQDRPLDLNMLGKEVGYYSRECVRWTDNNNQEWLSFLVVTWDNDFVLYSRPTDGTELTQLALSIETAPADTEEIQGLPEFHYTGDDHVLAVVLEQTLTESTHYLATPGGVFIPASSIVKTLEDGDDLIVFYYSVIYGYYRNGNTLCCESGGSGPARLRLTPDGNGGYTAIENIVGLAAGDHVPFCEEYGVSPDIFNSKEYHEERDDIRRDFIRMYVEENGLDDILYYKDYGWDPVSIR